jgi:hypothetical protein
MRTTTAPPMQDFWSIQRLRATSKRNLASDPNMNGPVFAKMKMRNSSRMQTAEYGVQQMSFASSHHTVLLCAWR